METFKICFSDISCRFAVDFILDSAHVHILSWGSTGYNISATKYVVLPNICRKMSCKSMMTRYHQRMNEDQNNNLKLSRTSFYKILQHIAHSGKIIISSVDYVSALLVTEHIEALQDVIEKILSQQQEKL